MRAAIVRLGFQALARALLAVDVKRSLIPLLLSFIIVLVV
jgi:hypothetical protein